MVVLGLVLVLLGVLLVLAAVFVSDPGTGGTLLGFDATVLGAFTVGIVAGALVLLGLGLLRWGTQRGLAHRREVKEYQRLQRKHGQPVESSEEPPPVG
ncbi:MAG: hypothetical protein ACI379_06590 [Nocardioides sp.]|uniref:hypothetical protein n=1 Tax=Nocardioides sp. TaxID=35761 RepID=UPI003F0CEB13